MTRKQAGDDRYDSYSVHPKVHDHFEGSAHCVECEGWRTEGWCTLTGADMAYTALVRALFEGEALTGITINTTVVKQLQRAGIDVGHFRRRAREAIEKWTNARQLR